MITVQDLLDKKPEPRNTIEETALTIEALSMLNTVNLSYLIVKDSEGEFRGIFCERDYCRNVILKGRSSRETPVSEVMTTDLPVVETYDTIEHCMNLMAQSKTRYLLAYSDEGFAGVITIHDLLRQVIANRELVFDHSLAEELLNHDESGKVY